MLVRTLRHLLAAVAFLLTTQTVLAEAVPLLHAMFQDHAVLQRDKPISIWGRAAANDRLTVSFAGNNATAQADGSGHWAATLPAMSAGGPYTLSVTSAAGARQTIEDVLVGDVWLCSGQSNMVLQVHRSLDSRAEIAGSANDSIRMLAVGLVNSLTPLETFSTPVRWEKAGPATVPEFSAACFYFAREMQKTVPVPMGLVNSSWGGSKIEAWMSTHALHDVGGYEDALNVLEEYAHDPGIANQHWNAMWENWWRRKTGERAGAEPWSVHTVREEDWRAAPPVLDYWEKSGIPELAKYDGMAWYRATVRLTAAQAAQRAVLSLGRIDEVDQAWVNGRAVGNTSGTESERAYPLPDKTLRAGENVIVVNVLDTYGSGGFNGPSAKRALQFADGSSAALDGHWRYRLAPQSSVGPPPRAPWDSTAGLTIIRNGMIAPIGPYKFRGVLWYQGESNTEDAGHYQALLASFMADWRGTYGADLPFLIVQLANYGPASSAPGPSGWASLREAQRLAVDSDPHAGLAVAVDIGDRYDIHPANKQEVARRLARVARHVVYGETLAPSGPVPSSAHRDGASVIVTFRDVDGGFVTYGTDRAIGFEICGAEQASCRYADAVARADRVELQLANQSSPTRVRFCWADSPVCNLYDRSGLPAGPFEIPIQ